MLNNVVAGTVGGTVGTVLNTPFDVVKSRIQNATKIPGQVPKYNWAIPALGTVAREEGLRALYKGFVPKGMFVDAHVLKLIFQSAGWLLVADSCLFCTVQSWISLPNTSRSVGLEEDIEVILAKFVQLVSLEQLEVHLASALLRHSLLNIPECLPLLHKWL